MSKSDDQQQELSLDDQSGGDHGSSGPYVVNPQEMIIANDVEAEAEDDEDEDDLNDDDDMDDDDMEMDVAHHGAHRNIAGGGLVVVDLEKQNRVSSEQNNSDSDDSSDSDSDSESGSGSDSGSSSDSGSGSDDESDSDDDEDGDDQPSSQQEQQQDIDEDEDDDEDEEVDIHEEALKTKHQQQQNNQTIKTMDIGTDKKTDNQPARRTSKDEQLEQQQQAQLREDQKEDKSNNDEGNSQQHQVQPASTTETPEETSNVDQHSSPDKNTISSRYLDKEEILKNCDEFGVYKWKEFEVARIKSFLPEEYQRFQRPFVYGWKRELVVRNGSTAEKKAGDVYYHLPDGSLKLRSLVEMTQFLKRNPQITDLDSSNFTFAKQPIYRPPDEIVRHAMQRGSNFVERPFSFNQHIKQKHTPNRNIGAGNAASGYHQQQHHQRHNNNQRSLLSTNNSSQDQQSQQQHSLLSTNDDSNDPPDGILGRGKRKRVLPSRYDDNDIDLISPVLSNKKSKTSSSSHQDKTNNSMLSAGPNRESYSNSNSNDGHSPQSNKSSSNINTGNVSGQKLSHQERRRQLQQQLYQQVSEEVKREREAAAAAAQQQQQKSSLKMKIVNKNGNKTATNSSLNKTPSASGEAESILDNNNDNSMMNDDQTATTNGHHVGTDDVGGEEATTTSSSSSVRQPCGAHCPGRRNMVPNLMCYSCFCLFHLECVPDGMFIDRKFYCPNCFKQQQQLQQLQQQQQEGSSLMKKTTTNDQENELTITKLNNNHHHRSSGHHHHHKHRSSTTSIASNIQSMLSQTMMVNPAELNHQQQSNSHSILLKQQLQQQQQNHSNHKSLIQKAKHHYDPHLMINGGSGFKKQSAAYKWQKKQQQILQQQQSDFPKLSSSLMAAYPSSHSSHRSHNNMLANSNKSTFQQKHSLSRKIVPPLPANRNLSSRSSSPQMMMMNGHHNGSNQLNFQPSINHVYRLAQAANGHAVVIKDRTQPLSSNNDSLLMNGASSNGQSSPSTGLSLHYLKQATKLLNEKQALLNAAAQQIARTQYYSTLKESSNSEVFDEFGCPRVRSLGALPINQHSKYWKYQMKRNNVLNRFNSMMIVLNNIVEHLDWKDIQSLRLVNRQWCQMLSTPIIWRDIRLRGSTISDWKYFYTNIVQQKPVQTIDFIGIRIPIQSTPVDPNNSNRPTMLTRNEKICNFWRQFQTNVLPSGLPEITSLRFGTMPLFLLKELLSQQHCPKLQHLAVLNLFDESRPNDPCSLEFLSSGFKDLKLESLHLDSKNGLVLPEDCMDSEQLNNIRQEQFDLILDTLKQLSSNEIMKAFHCTSLKNLSKHEFAQIIGQLNPVTMRYLSIGSCQRWFDVCKQDEQSQGNTADIFDQLSRFDNLISLRFRDLNITKNAASLVNLFESLIIIERLTLDNLCIHKSAKLTWTSFAAILKSLPLTDFCVSSSDPFTNRCLFETIIQLLSTQKRSIRIFWSVTVNIDDIGRCFVPLSLESFLLENVDLDGHVFAEKYCSKLDISRNQESSTLTSGSSLFQVVPEPPNDDKENQQEDQDNTRPTQQMILMEMDTVHDVILQMVKKRRTRSAARLSDAKFIGPSSSLIIIPQ